MPVPQAPAASAEGFRDVSKRVRQAVVDSERLLMVLDRLVRQGLRRRGSSGYLSPSEVQDPIQAVREAVGRLGEVLERLRPVQSACWGADGDRPIRVGPRS